MTHRCANTSSISSIVTNKPAIVAYAHEQQVIHRDIKPGNILVTADGTPKLLGFGIAKILDPDLAADTLDPTVTAMRLMTPDYASPEQARGEQVTPATDQYSLGVLLYELLTGRCPYQLRSRPPYEIARIISEEKPEKPSDVVNRVRTATARNGRREIVLSPEEISRDRGSTPDELRRELAGGLDDIVLKPSNQPTSISSWSNRAWRAFDQTRALPNW
jgi:serine/threonine protein kinase